SRGCTRTTSIPTKAPLVGGQHRASTRPDVMPPWQPVPSRRPRLRTGRRSTTTTLGWRGASPFPGALGSLSREVRVLWVLLSVGSALFQVLRNMVMKRLGHALDETINVWGRFTFILPFAAAPLLFQGLPARQPGVYWYALLFGVT